MRSPGICCWFSDHSNCSHWSFESAVLPIKPNIYIDQCEPIVIYRLITLAVVIQLCSSRCWQLDSNHTMCRKSQLRFVMLPLLLHLRLKMFQSDIPLFMLTWPAKRSPNQAWESTHRSHLYSLGGAFNSPSIEHQVGGTSILRFIKMTVDIHGNYSRNPNRTAWHV